MDRLTDTATAAPAIGGGAQGRLHFHQYELLFEMTTQLLAAQTLDEQLMLTLDTLTSGLGYPHAAVALIDKNRAVLRTRMAVGFEDDERARGLELPLDSSGPHVTVAHDGRPAWVTRAGSDASSVAFLDALGCPTDLLALPLFGGQFSH